MQLITITDENGKGVTGAGIEVRWSTTNEIIDNGDMQTGFDDGQYVIFSDRQVNDLSQTGIEITVSISVAGYVSQERIFVFNTDECLCHINLLSGSISFILISE